ncbi:MAG: DNA cytosine methyltransferase, partial [Candidatus Helarchaeota archaeon]
IALMENVKGLTTYKMEDKLLINIIIKKFKAIGYKVDYAILNALNFGVPQNRERLFILAIRSDLNIIPKLPQIIKEIDYKTLTLKEAISDLPTNINEENDYHQYVIPFDNATDYQKIMRENNSDIIYNHTTISTPSKYELTFLNKIPQGKVFRSSRFGKKYIGVWDLFKEKLKSDERDLLLFLCKKRTLINFRELKGKYQEGFIRIENFPTNKEGKFQFNEMCDSNQNRTPEEILNSLYKNGWLRKKEFGKFKDKYIAYDINTKSGIRPKYRRLSYLEPSLTILTNSFRVQEFIHPIANRPISLREGARIQSFPDNFIFYGNKGEIAKMIGNAVPPLMAYFIGLFIRNILDQIENKIDSYKLIEKSVYN